MICRWCGARSVVEDADAEHSCRSCAGYWYARMGWVPRVPLERAGARATVPPAPRHWTFTDAEGLVVAEWPPPPEEAARTG